MYSSKMVKQCKDNSCKNGKTGGIQFTVSTITHFERNLNKNR